MIDPSIFRPYNIRGIYPDQLNEETARRIAQGFIHVLKPRKLVLGRDVRLSSPALHQVFLETILDAGVDVTDIGIVSTDMLYFATGKYDFDAGFIISASHNAAQWNGFKAVKKGVVPASLDEMAKLREWVLSGQTPPSGKRKGKLISKDILDQYLAHSFSFVDTSTLKPIRMVANGNFGTVGRALKELANRLPVELIQLNLEPDGNFPKGQPDPLLPQMRVEVTETAKKEKVDIAAAWDSDADRCYIHDEKGDFVRGSFMTAFLAKHYLAQEHHGKVVSERRVIWPVKETVEAAGGQYILSPTGYPFIRAKMIEVDAVFGGENSAHYFTRANWSAENGLLPFLIVWETLSKTGKKVSELFAPWRERYFVSEEYNSTLPTIAQSKEVLDKAEKKFGSGATIEHVDGLSVEFPDWRFNLRVSNNEPLIRLNVEARSQKLLDEKTAELTEFVKKLS